MVTKEQPRRIRETHTPGAGLGGGERASEELGSRWTTGAHGETPGKPGTGVGGRSPDAGGAKGASLGAHPGLCAAPGVCIRGGRLGESAVTLERMGPAWDLETAVTKRNRPLKSPPASDATATKGEQTCFAWAPARPSQASSREALCIPCVCQLAVAQAWESAASLQRPRPGLSPSRALAAARGRETEARNAEMRLGLRAPRPEWAGCRGRGAGRAPGAPRDRGGDVRDPRPGTARTPLPGRPRGVSARSPHRRGCSGVPAPAQPSGRGQEAAVTV